MGSTCLSIFANETVVFIGVSVDAGNDLTKVQDAPSVLVSRINAAVEFCGAREAKDSVADSDWMTAEPGRAEDEKDPQVIVSLAESSVPLVTPSVELT